MEGGVLWYPLHLAKIDGSNAKEQNIHTHIYN